MKDLKLIEESKRDKLDLVVVKTFVAGQLDGICPVEEFRSELQSLLQQQATITREETIRECIRTVVNWVNDHYFDSLEGQKDILLLHLQNLISILTNQTNE